MEPGLAGALSLSTGNDRMITPALGLAFLLQAPATGGSALAPLAFQFVLIVAIIYFIMWRPQQKQRKQHETSLAQLKRGDEVVTAGGIVGEVVHIREMAKDPKAKGNAMEDRITIRSGEAKLVVERGRIARIVGGTTTSASGTATT